MWGAERMISMIVTGQHFSLLYDGIFLDHYGTLPQLWGTFHCQICHGWLLDGCWSFSYKRGVVNRGWWDAWRLLYRWFVNEGYMKDIYLMDKACALYYFSGWRIEYLWFTDGLPMEYWWMVGGWFREDNNHFLIALAQN
jgi:hypothetical protein